MAKKITTKKDIVEHWQLWLNTNNIKPSKFQKESWKLAIGKRGGIISAPTGNGKTIAALGGALIRCALEVGLESDSVKSVKILLITPLQSLARNTTQNIKSVTEHFFPRWNVGIRTGDASAKDKTDALKGKFQILVTTPESLAVMISQESSGEVFQHLNTVVVDEWHELSGNKRGVLLELNLARLRKFAPHSSFWGLSATIGNLEKAVEVLVPHLDQNDIAIVSDIRAKKYHLNLLIPHDEKRLPWAGHLGLSNLGEVLQSILDNASTIVFTNTRVQAELWYAALASIWPLEAKDLLLHHGSLDREVREQVEHALRVQDVRCVVATSSLELGVDFPGVDHVIQIGSPHSVTRTMQRAGRAKHQPTKPAHITVVATQALELYEFLAIQQLIDVGWVEPKPAIQGCLDVLAQHVLSCALAKPIRSDELWEEIRTTHAYSSLKKQAWQAIIEYLCFGGSALEEYPTYRKLSLNSEGFLLINDKKIARNHRFNIGTISSRSAVNVQFLRGGRIGSVEEAFISKLQPGDVFDFSGKSLELFKMEGMTAWVKLSKKKGNVRPAWTGDTLSFSPVLGNTTKLEMVAHENKNNLKSYLAPMRELQIVRSTIPNEHELLIENITLKGSDINQRKNSTQKIWFIYPFCGRTIHESLALLIAYRLSQIENNTFNWSVNHYGFMIFSEKSVDIDESLWRPLFSTQNLCDDLEKSLNFTELMRRKFREIAQISSLIYGKSFSKNYSAKQMQVSSGLLFDVLNKYDKEHVLLQETKRQVLEFDLNIEEVKKVLNDMQQQKFVFTYPEKLTPFSFGLWAEALRGLLTNESWAERVQRVASKMQK